MATETPVRTDEGVHVNVLLRCRPANAQEIAERAPQAIQCHEALKEVTLFQNVGGKQMSRTFRYDKVFGPDSKQEKVYNQAIVPIVEEVLDGFNCTIFAYGQTGTGKTFTMEGGPRNSADGKALSAEAGVIPRAIKQIFDAIECEQVSDSSVKVSFLELYNEELTDLLSMADDKEKKLRLLEDRSGVVVQGLEEVVVKNAAEIYQVLDRGTAKRRTAETLLNKRSSRSHSVFAITIHMKETTPEGEDVIKIGKLNLVDLAGSENISRSGAKDGRAREAGSINQSLLTLGRVITALVEHSGHVPYRDSKLTRLLRDSLGGKTKTCIIATIAPSVQCMEETISTLDYAHRAKNIRNRPEVNQRISKTTMIKELASEIERLKLDLVATREKNGIYISMERYEANEMERAQLREGALRHKAELEAAALAHAEEMEARTTAHERRVEGLERLLQGAQQELEQTRGQLVEAQVDLEQARFVILSHQRSEAALSSHAQQLQEELGGAAQQLGSVFGALGAALQVQAGDRQALGAVVAEAQAGLGRLKAALEGAVDGQGRLLRGMSAQVAAFESRKQQELSQLQQQVAALHAGSSTLQQQVAQLLESQAEAAGGALTSGFDQQKRALEAACQALKTASGAAEGALQQLTSQMAAQAQHITTWAEQQAEHHQQQLQGLSALLDTASSGVGGVQSAAQQLQAAAGANSSSISSQLVEFSSSFEAAVAGQQEVLLQQVAQLVGGFVSQQRAAVGSMVGSLRQQAAQGQAAVEAAHKEVEAAAAACLKDLQVDAAAQKDQAQAAAAAAAKALKALAGTAASSSAAAGQAAAQLAAGTGEVVAGLAAHVQAAERDVSTAARAAVSAAKECQQALGAGSQQLAAAADAVLAAGQQQLQQDGAVAQEWAAAVDGIKGAVKGLASSQSQELAALSAATQQPLAARQGVAPPALGPAPAVVVPAAELLGQLVCPPEEVLVGQFRLERAALVERGEDPAGVFELLLPGAAAAAAAAAASFSASQASADVASDDGAADVARDAENVMPPPSPASSLASVAASVVSEKAGPAAVGVTTRRGARSRIPTYGAGGGLSDRTNLEP